MKTRKTRNIVAAGALALGLSLGVVGLTTASAVTPSASVPVQAAAASDPKPMDPDMPPFETLRPVDVLQTYTWSNGQSGDRITGTYNPVTGSLTVRTPDNPSYSGEATVLLRVFVDEINNLGAPMTKTVTFKNGSATTTFPKAYTQTADVVVMPTG